MSRNFELLRKAEMEQELFGTPTPVASRSAPTTPPAPDIGQTVVNKRPLVGEEEAELEQELFGTTTPVASRSAPTTRPAPAKGQNLVNKRPLVGEEEAKLVQRLFLSGHGRLRFVVFCGAEPEASAGWVCARASEVLAAQASGRVCAVDANLSLPRLHQYFGVPSWPGLTDALSDHGSIQSFTRQTGVANLWLMSCGSNASESRPLLKIDRLHECLADLRSEFDYILVSAPSAHLSTDAITLGQFSDGVVLVLEANSTRREVAQKSRISLETANVKLLGAVLNNRTFPIPEAIYNKL